MRIGILTNEYPPHVYGGAGVHVEYLTRELAALDDGRHQVDNAAIRTLVSFAMAPPERTNSNVE